MSQDAIFRIIADLLLVLHAAFVAFVVLGLVLVVCGGFRGWAWIRNPWFRFGHVAAIGVVTVQAWLGRICPLTIWEMSLRERAADTTYGGTFMAHWLHELLYYDMPPWVFVAAYTLFGLAVLGAWIKFPPGASER